MDGAGGTGWHGGAVLPWRIRRNFAIFSLWLSKLFGTEARATASAFCTSKGRFIGAGVNFGLAGAVAAVGTLGTPIALTSIAFAIGLLIVPFTAPEEKSGPNFATMLEILFAVSAKKRGTSSIVNRLVC